MDTKVENGNFVLSSTGLPRTVEGLEELLQYARMSLSLRRGEFPYGRELGSGLWKWDPEEEHALDRALALANEALLWLPGVRAVEAARIQGGAAFVVETPLGKGEVEIGGLSGNTGQDERCL